MSYGDENDLHEVAGALREVATAILKLGNGSIPATSPIGAVEGLAMKIDDGAESIASSISNFDLSDVAEAIKTVNIQQLADAISDGNYNEKSLSVAVTSAGKEIAGGIKDLAAAIREMRGVVQC